MKNKLLFSVLACVILGAAACTNLSDDNSIAQNPVLDDGLCHLSVTATTVKTRGHETGSPADIRIDNVQVFVFRNTGGADNGILDASGSASGTTVDLSCTFGPKIVYAVTNAPLITNVSTVNELKAVVTNLSDNLRENLITEKFVMVGRVEKNMDFINPTLSVEVTRRVSKVVLETVYFDMSSAYYQNSDIVFRKAYLTNAVTVAHLDEAYTPVAADYVNKGFYSSTSVDHLLYYDVNEEIEPDYLKYTSAITFYAYPNPSTGNDTSMNPWTIRRTRLVIECSFNSEIFYYPIDLPALEANTCYTIERVTITRPGGKDPNKPIEFGDLTYNLTITDWETTTLTDGTII